MEQYTILGRIGEGAHGIVFKARHIEVNLFQGTLVELFETNLLSKQFSNCPLIYQTGKKSRFTQLPGFDC